MHFFDARMEKPVRLERLVHQHDRNVVHVNRDKLGKGHDAGRHLFVAKIQRSGQILGGGLIVIQAGGRSSRRIAGNGIFSNTHIANVD